LLEGISSVEGSCCQTRVGSARVLLFSSVGFVCFVFIYVIIVFVFVYLKMDWGVVFFVVYLKMGLGGVFFCCVPKMGFEQLQIENY